MQNAKHTVFRVLTENLGLSASEVTLDASFTKDLGIDSLDFMELIMELELAFKISIPQTDVSTLYVVNDLIEYIEGRIIIQRDEAA